MFPGIPHLLRLPAPFTGQAGQAGISIFVFCVSSLLALTIAGCVPPCSNRVVYETMSPGGDYKAVVFERQCGDDGGAHTQISILTSNAELSDEGGNVFSADMGFISVQGGSRVDVQWSGRHELHVAHSAQAVIFKSERRVGDVSIVYSPR